MSFFDSIISALSPAWALKRVQAQYLLRAYEAAKPGVLRKKSRDKRTPSAVARESKDSLRDQARHLDENHDIAHGILNTLVANIIGRGLEIEPLARKPSGELHDALNQTLSELWRDWCYSPEVTDEMNWATVERQACRAWLRDGEIFAQKITGTRADLNHVSAVPYSIELIESDYVPTGYGYPAKNAMDGILRDGWGRAKTYFIAKRASADITPGFDFVQIPAENILHLKFTSRINQNRGVSIFAPVMTRLEDIKDYEESERIAAKIAASMAAAIKKGSPDLYTPESSGDPRSLRFQPGMIFDDLLPGESIEMIDSNRPNPNLVTFREGQLKAIASGTASGYSSIAKSYDASYAAQRQEMVESYALYFALRDHFVERFSRLVWKGFIDAVVLAGLVDIRGLDRATLNHADFRGPPMPWIDQKKEVEAEIAAIQAGLKSRSQSIREHGGKPQIVRNEIENERTKDNSSNLIFLSDYAHVKTTKTSGNGNDTPTG